MRKNNQKGMGLLELMLALGIIALLLLGAIKYYQVVRVSSGSNETLKHVVNIIAASERWAAGHQGSFAGITEIKILIDAELIPADFSRNEWGGMVDVVALSSHKIKITLTGLPSNICYNLGQKLSVPEADLEKQCTVDDANISSATLLYCYPDQKKCQS